MKAAILIASALITVACILYPLRAIAFTAALWSATFVGCWARDVKELKRAVPEWVN